MPIVGYSPWADAANYGAGLGETLGRILLQVPQQRAELRMQQQQFPLQQQLMQAQINEANLRPGLQQQAMAIKSLQEQLAAQRAGVTEDYERERIRQIIQDEYRKDHPDQFGKPPTEQQDFGQGRQAVKDYVSDLANKQNIDFTKTPVSVAPDLMSGSLQSATGSKTPYQDVIKHLQSIGASLQAILQTNQIPDLKTNFFGSVSQLPTTHPQVTTNAYELRAPQGQPPVAAPPTNSVPPMTAVNPQTKQRIVSYDGGNSWQPLTQ